MFGRINRFIVGIERTLRNLKFGCRGHSHLDHVLCYWVGSSAGALASIYAYPALKRVFMSGGSEEDRKKTE